MGTEEIIQLTDSTFGGDALGRLSDGRAVFVRFGLPAETVKIRLTEQKTTFQGKNYGGEGLPSQICK